MIRNAKLCAILAMSENHVIGNSNSDNGLPWDLKDEMKYFRITTTGDGKNGIVFGRNTWCIFGKPLPKRLNVVLSSLKDLRLPEGVVLSNSIEEILEMADSGLVHGQQIEKLFVGGGLEVYRQLMEQCDELYHTEVHAEVEGDIIYDDLDLTNWKLVFEERHEADEKNKYPFTCRRYERISRTDDE